MIVADWMKPVTGLFDKIYTTDVTVWYLHRQTPPEPLGTLPFTYRCETHPNASTYRPLYDGVGGPWLWWERRALSESQLEDQFANGDRMLVIPEIEGTAIGMIELGWPSDRVAEIRNFGLMPEHVGQGFGRALMRLALNQAWRAGTREVQLNTCSLDHPAALKFYKKNGFAQVTQQSGKVQIPHRHIDDDLLAAIKDGKPPTPTQRSTAAA